jgi:hypothetical protein
VSLKTSAKIHSTDESDENPSVRSKFSSFQSLGSEKIGDSSVDEGDVDGSERRSKKFKVVSNAINGVNDVGKGALNRFFRLSASIHAVPEHIPSLQSTIRNTFGFSPLQKAESVKVQPTVPLLSCSFEDETFAIPACHGNSVIKFDFLEGGE